MEEGKKREVAAWIAGQLLTEFLKQEQANISMEWQEVPEFLGYLFGETFRLLVQAMDRRF